MKKAGIEMIVGIFMVVGILCLAFLSIKLGKLEIMGGNFYNLSADFSSVSGLKAGASVEIAGVEIGRVDRIELDPDRGYVARVFLRVRTGVMMTDDSIAAIRTNGIIGDKFVMIKPGGSEKMLADGGKIRETESALDLEQVLSEYIHGKV
jgi:phospholipid/cholesterol/gamma-HCH transport system substrate-binding protein